VFSHRRDSPFGRSADANVAAVSPRNKPFREEWGRPAAEHPQRRIAYYHRAATLRCPAYLFHPLSSTLFQTLRGLDRFVLAHPPAPRQRGAAARRTQCSIATQQRDVSAAPKRDAERDPTEPRPNRAATVRESVPAMRSASIAQENPQ